jgi:hypothetical protein
VKQRSTLDHSPAVKWPRAGCDVEGHRTVAESLFLICSRVLTHEEISVLCVPVCCPILGSAIAKPDRGDLPMNNHPSG